MTSHSHSSRSGRPSTCPIAVFRARSLIQDLASSSYLNFPGFYSLRVPPLILFSRLSAQIPEGLSWFWRRDWPRQLVLLHSEQRHQLLTVNQSVNLDSGLYLRDLGYFGCRFVTFLT